MLHILNRLISSLIVFQVYIEFKMPLSVNSQLDNKIPLSLVGKFYKQFAYLTCCPLDRIDAPNQAAVSTSRQLVDRAALRHFNQSDGTLTLRIRVTANLRELRPTSDGLSDGH